MQSLAIIATSIAAAILYGIAHDQITVRICVEYFTIGHPRLIQSESPTILGLFWGIVATWWVGLALGIELAIAARIGKRPKLRLPDILHLIKCLMTAMFAFAILAGLIGFTTATTGVFFLVEPFASRVPEERHTAFLTVGWAHSASYLSGFIGGIILWIKTWRKRGILAEADHSAISPTLKLKKS
jgi:hypothetical protein